VVNFTHSKLGTSYKGHVERKIMKIVLKEYTASFKKIFINLLQGFKGFFNLAIIRDLFEDKSELALQWM
jgi:hypothetical protein